jgi:hypothetical protein
MRKKALFLFILCFLFILFLFFRFFVMSKEAGTGTIKALSSPDASIFVDNVAIGKTPFENKMKEGEYIIKFIPEGTATNTASWQGKVHIYKDTLTYIDRELGTSDLTSSGVVFTTTKMTSAPQEKDTGEIEIHTEPAGAIVYLDNDQKGIAPLILSNVSKGDHELSIFSPSFFRRTQKINVDPGYKVNADFKLSIDESQKQLILTPTPKESTSSATKKDVTITVLDTPLGFLRVRAEPNISASEEAQVKPGSTYPLVETAPNWYKISYEKNKQGWISAEYAKKN